MPYRLVRLWRSIPHRLEPPRHGPLALTVVFAPYLFPLLAFLLALPRWRYAALLRPLLLVAAIASIARSVARPTRRHAAPGAPSFSVMSWNILFSNPRVDAMLRFLATAPAEIIALQELRADHVERIAADPALRRHYPHQILWPYGYGAGMGLLSRYPIVEQGRLDLPPTLWTRLDLGDGRRLLLVSAHPTFFPPRMEEEEPDEGSSPMKLVRRVVDPRFFWYDPAYRDDGIARVRALAEPLLRQGEALLIVGDFNVTEREPAYREFAGLLDVHRDAGSGTGRTWRPEWLAGLPLPILRLDYMWSSPNIRPLRMRVDHTLRGSDHCPILGLFEWR